MTEPDKKWSAGKKSIFMVVLCQLAEHTVNGLRKLVCCRTGEVEDAAAGDDRFVYGSQKKKK